MAKNHRNILQRSKRPNNYIYIQRESQEKANRVHKGIPGLCKLVADDGFGCLTFEINKDNFMLRVMKPTSNEKREKAREQMNKLRGKKHYT